MTDSIVYGAAPGYAESAKLINISLLCEYLHGTVALERRINPILAAVLKYEISILYTVSPPPLRAQLPDWQTPGLMRSDKSS